MSDSRGVKLIPISPAQLESCVTTAFKGDKWLLHKYHVSPGTLEHCVHHTVANIGNDIAHFGIKVQLYKVCIGGVDIGYTVFIKEKYGHTKFYLLSSFGINIEYRTKEVLLPWLEQVSWIAGDDYSTALHPCNKRAISFFKRNGFKAEKKENFILLKSKILQTCQ